MPQQEPSSHPQHGLSASLSATRTVPSKTKTSANQERLARQSRRDASHVIALAREAARKETRTARSDLARLQRESLDLETHIAQLRAAISKDCPSSENLKFQSRLLRAEDRQRKLAEQAELAHSKAFGTSRTPSPLVMSPKKNEVAASEPHPVHGVDSRLFRLHDVGLQGPEEAHGVPDR